jgi:hypothetical protein
MSTVVAIHNTVNERAWQHVLAWEALHACDCAAPKLLRFRGRPADYSPKARLLNLLVGCQGLAFQAVSFWLWWVIDGGRLFLFFCSPEKSPASL